MRVFVEKIKLGEGVLLNSMTQEVDMGRRVEERSPSCEDG